MKEVVMPASTYHVIKDPVHDTIQFTSQENSWIKPFNDCVGCCYVGSQIARKIGLNDEDKQLVMIACLLHDIGHGPFSHAFEGVFHKSIIRHELWTRHFLAEYETDEFFTLYNDLNPRAQLNKEKFRIIADIIMNKPVKKHVLADIVSSQLDADRLDYLLRGN